MSQPVAEQTAYERLVTELAERLRQVCRPEAAAGEGIIRLESKIDPVDPLSWLASQKTDSKIYWRDRDGSSETAGIGVADIISEEAAFGFDEITAQVGRRLANTDDRSRYYGGFRFDAPRCEGRRDPSWQEFGSARMVLPRIELTRSEDNHSLAINLLPEELNQATLAKLAGQLQNLIFAPSAAASPALQSTSMRHTPDSAGWGNNVSAAIKSFAEHKTEKIVLARKTDLDFSTRVQPWLLLDKLRQSSVDCFLFGIQPGHEATFVGATPELLYRRDGNQLKSEAIAGTRVRGQSEPEDIALEIELFTSDKERREHQLVVDSLRNGLEHLCSEFNESDHPRPLKLARVQHLKTDFTGLLLPSITDADILASLHPTAAVGGYPAAIARREIERLESFDRGWYAGPVGWINGDSAEFAVAIRSGLVAGRKLSLYSGAGIVEGSTAAAEWQEIDSKISNFIRAITG